MAGVTSAFTDQAKQDFLKGIHIVGTHTFKLALVKSTATGTYDKTTTGAGTPGTGAPAAGALGVSNLGTDETPASGTYSAGGFTLTPAVTLSTDTAILDFTTDPSWTTATLSAIGAMIYNDSVAGKPVIAVISFGGTVASTNGTFTVTLPTADASNGLIRIA